MKQRLVVKYREGNTMHFVNIGADRITEHDGFLVAYCGEEMIGAFDLGFILAAYLSGEVAK